MEGIKISCPAEFGDRREGSGAVGRFNVSCGGERSEVRPLCRMEGGVVICGVMNLGLEETTNGSAGVMGFREDLQTC